MRQLIDEDAAALQEFHKGLSAESIHRRFFQAKPVLTDTEALHFTHVDHVRRQALCAVLGTAIIGVARYDRFHAEEAEVAVIVTDAFQKQGIGSWLLEALRQDAIQNGINVFTAEVLAGNSAMLHAFERLGSPIDSSWENGVLRLRIGPLGELE
jgi:GNAT superfamily N-acetyltransferase